MTSDPRPRAEMVLCQTEDGRTRIQCRFEDESIWLTQAQIADLSLVTVPTVNERLQGIWSDGEVSGAATIRKFRVVRFEGRREVARDIEHCRLEANSSRTRSDASARLDIDFPQAYHFQLWASWTGRR